MLNMSDFRDKSRSDAWDFSAFVRTYAMYLDERLEYRMQGQKHRSVSVSCSRDDELIEAEAPMGDYVEDREREMERERDRERERKEGSSSNSIFLQGGTPVREMKIDSLFFRVKILQNLLERFLACRPTGTVHHYSYRRTISFNALLFNLILLKLIINSLKYGPNHPKNLNINKNKCKSWYIWPINSICVFGMHMISILMFIVPSPSLPVVQ